MKVHASSFLKEEKLWHIIDDSNKGIPSLDEQSKKLIEEIDKLSEDEIIGYMFHFNKFYDEAYNGDLWAVAYIVMGGCSDDGFDYFRYWLVTRGKEVYSKAILNADSLCDEFDKVAKGDVPEFEEVAYIASNIFEEKFKQDYDQEEEKYDTDYTSTRLPFALNWDEDDEDSMIAICPNTFDKWWLNDRF